jgi:hypothetical protein
VYQELQNPSKVRPTWQSLARRRGTGIAHRRGHRSDRQLPWWREEASALITNHCGAFVVSRFSDSADEDAGGVSALQHRPVRRVVSL